MAVKIIRAIVSQDNNWSYSKKSEYIRTFLKPLDTSNFNFETLSEIVILGLESLRCDTNEITQQCGQCIFEILKTRHFDSISSYLFEKNIIDGLMTDEQEIKNGFPTVATLFELFKDSNFDNVYPLVIKHMNKIFKSSQKMQLVGRQILDEKLARNNLRAQKLSEISLPYLMKTKKGIYNSGNNCYLNSFLQILVHTDAVRSILISTKPVSKPNTKPESTSVVKALQNICGLYLSGKSTVLNPAALKRCMGGIWAGEGQQDSFEFALSLMDHMDNCVPDAIKPLCGSFHQSVLCKNCGHKATKSEPFYTLTLQLANKKEDSEVLEDMIVDEHGTMKETKTEVDNKEETKDEMNESKDENKETPKDLELNLMDENKGNTQDSENKEENKENIQDSENKENIQDSEDKEENKENIQDSENKAEKKENIGNSEKKEEKDENIVLKSKAMNLFGPAEVKKEDEKFTIESLLENFCSAEKLILDNKIQCSSTTCNNSFQDGEKVVNIETGPNILLVNLAYFEYNKTTNQRTKIFNKKVSYGEVLRLPTITATGETEYIIYHLYGVIVHNGSTCHSGHYYAYAKNSQIQGEGSNHWFKLNDSAVGSSNFEDFSAHTDSASSDVTYMLFYVKDGYSVDLRVEALDEIKRAVSIDVDNTEKPKIEVKKVEEKPKVTPIIHHYDNNFGDGGSGGFDGGGFAGGFGGGGGWGVA
jgi:ubiquitin C-terminal hydrolase